MLFTDAHREQLERVGFTRVPGVIPVESANNVLNALQEVACIDINDPATWYLLPESYPGIIPSHHHQSQWDIRQHPRLHQVFSDLWRTPALWVTMDRIGFVPPLRPTDTEGCTLHWDLDPHDEATYQGIVYLTEASPERAPFCTAPQIFQDLEAWLARMPQGFDFTCVDFSREPRVAVPGDAGDLIIWNSKLPHGPGPNRASSPRVMQAVTLFPPSRATWRREEQIDWWRTKRAPPWWRDVPGQRDPEPGERAVLTEHGQRLVGLRDWGE
jgi:Phytanoyl-CoA dioxygenase (PhyH)